LAVFACQHSTFWWFDDLLYFGFDHALAMEDLHELCKQVPQSLSVSRPYTPLSPGLEGPDSLWVVSANTQDQSPVIAAAYEAAWDKQLQRQKYVRQRKRLCPVDHF
jgi:hypothetical protein